MNWHKIVGPYSNPDVVLPSDRDTCQAFVLPTKQASLWIVGGYAYGNIARREILYSFGNSSFAHWSAATPWEPFTRVAMHNGQVIAVDRTSVWRADGVPPDAASFVQVANSPIAGQDPAREIISLKGKLHLFGADGMRSSEDDGGTWSAPVVPAWGLDKDFRVKVCGRRAVAFVWARFAANVPAELSYPDQTTLATMYFADEPEGAWQELDCPFLPRRWPAFCEHLGSIFVFGGFNPWVANTSTSQANLNDLWRYDPDGRWHLMRPSLYPTPRHGAELVSLDGKLCLYGGNSGPSGSPANTLFDAWEFY